MGKDLQKVALGGGCHWCTEAVFQTIVGVDRVEQGYVAATGSNASFSEAVIVHFNTNKIALRDLIEIHLYTHKSTSEHSLRDRYRSAVYTFHPQQEGEAKGILKMLQKEFDKPLVTQVLPFSSFKPSREEITNYYYNNPQKPFCETYIAPKLKLLMERFSEVTLQR